MKLSKQQESELLKAYNRWWHSYLNGDIETYDSFFDDEYHFVGSTDGEEYLDRENTTAFLRATANQLAGKAELRNLQRAIETLDEGLVLITDLADAYVLSEGEWVYYSRFRFSSLMRNGKKGWQFVYQHFSAPDTKAEEGETLGCSTKALSLSARLELFLEVCEAVAGAPWPPFARGLLRAALARQWLVR